MTPTSTLNPKTLTLLALIVMTQVLGDIWLSRGMKLFGPITSYQGPALLALLAYLFTSPWIVLGVATLACSLLLYLVAVSRLDLSLVLPLLASSYLLNACLAWLILGEHVSALRWVATLLIALGVYVVFQSERQRQKQQSQALGISSAPPLVASTRKSNRPRPNSWLLAFPLGLSLSKVWLGILLVVLADSCGDLLVTQGMKRIGPLALNSPRAVLGFISRILRHPWILGGISCQAIAFVCFISLLSWADISLVRPATALGYGVSLLGARFILREHITPERWLGSSIIGLGVFLIALDV
ncbi:hypothetical protein [Synechocystis sp. LKSZ1]|uniref:hypothetical protein n=1 Tax=Synechocystis sp. LKSZ1 TaxID=3144951 RepID=UPI00336BD82C